MQLNASVMRIDIKIIIFSVFLSVCVGSRTYYFPRMCDYYDKEINDCSVQFPLSEANSCQVYNTKVCKRYDFSSWNLKPLFRPVSEADSEYNVTILPYAMYTTKNKGTSISAINITFATLNRDISGFSLQLSDDARGRNVCRIFDFRQSVDKISVPNTFFYDCFNGLVEDGWENVSIAFKAYPLNIELSYFVYVPPKQIENLILACDWKPLVMVFRGGLPENDVQIKFSNAPEKLEIMFFNVTLVDSSGRSIHNRILSSIKNDMISNEFHVVDAGYYSVHVGVITGKESCPNKTETNFFYVGKEIKDYSATIVLVIIIILIIICVPLLIYFSCQLYIRNATPTSKPTLLLVYSYKRLYHEFLVMYGRYLENHYGVKINMIYERSGNPKTWLVEKYSQSDIVVFVISSNLKALDQDAIDDGEHHWVDQLAEAKALIEDSYIGQKKICKICFSYSGIDDIPKCLEHQGPFFMLPEDFDKFLCFIFKCPRKLYLLSKLFHMKHHKVLKPNIKLDNEDEIKEKLKIILGTKNVTKNSVQKLNNTNESNMQFECKWQINMEENKSDTSNERRNFTSDNLLKNCGDGNLELPQQELNFNESENDDFMRYCVRKILYSV